MFLPTNHPIYFPDDILALFLYLSSSHLLDWTCTLWPNPGGKPAWEVSSSCSSPHLWLQHLRHSYSFQHIHPSSKPAQALRAGSGFRLCFHRILCTPPLLIPHPSPCKGIQPLQPLQAGCVPTWSQNVDEHWLLGDVLSHNLMSAGHFLVKTCSSLSCLQAETEILLVGEKNNCRSLALL